MEAGRTAAGSSRIGVSFGAEALRIPGAPHRVGATGAPLRLDPFSLPVRFAAADEAADGCLRIVDLYRERVVLRRSLRGIRMALNVPVSAFRGVAIRVAGKPGAWPSAISVVLEHGDPALSLPLFCAPESDDVLAEWQSWGRVLGLPLLVAEPDGSLSEPFARLGALRIEPPARRRRRRTAVARRRPALLHRRRVDAPAEMPAVHRGACEIIARD